MSKKRQDALFFPHAKPGAKITSLVYDYKDGEFIEPHFHDEDQLVFASQGVMRIQTEDGVWVVPSQRALWIPGGVVHSIQNSGLVSMRTLYFVPNFVRVLPRKCLVMNVSSLLRELILFACGREKLSLKNPKEKRLIEIIIDQLASREEVPLQIPIPADRRAKKIAEILIAGPADERKFDQLCRECGASKRTIERIFRHETGLTLGKWRQQMRMLQAVQMLGSGEKIITVALETGYNGPSAFTAAFRKVFGTTPSHYISGI